MKNQAKRLDTSDIYKGSFELEDLNNNGEFSVKKNYFTTVNMDNMMDAFENQIFKEIEENKAKKNPIKNKLPFKKPEKFKNYSLEEKQQQELEDYKRSINSSSTTFETEESMDSEFQMRMVREIDFNKSTSVDKVKLVK